MCMGVRRADNIGEVRNGVEHMYVRRTRWRHGHRDGFVKACVVYAVKVCLCQICRGTKRNAGAQTRLIARVNAVDRC